MQVTLPYRGTGIPAFATRLAAAVDLLAKSFFGPTTTTKAPPTPTSLEERQQIALVALEQIGGRRLGTIRRIEDMSLEQLRAKSTRNTIFAPVIKALARKGVEVGDTVGDVMDTLQLDQRQIHAIACACHSWGSSIRGIRGDHAAIALQSTSGLRGIR